MMKQNLHIQSELILNHIELTDEDLSELPPYPKVEEKRFNRDSLELYVDAVLWTTTHL